MRTFALILTLSFFFVVKIDAQDIAVLTKNSSTIKKKTSKIAKTVFVPNFELHASFNGELEELAEFLESNLVYPELGRVNNIEGIVLVQFTVAADGSIQDAKVIKGLGQGLGFDEEVLRLVNLMPKWKPAQQGVRAVNSKVRMPIAFSL